MTALREDTSYYFQPMKKRVLLLSAFLFLVAIGAVGTWVYRGYLTPARLIPAVREAIEEAVGQPIDLEDARVVGIGTVAFGRIRIPAANDDVVEDPWFSAPSATVRLELGKLLARRSLSLEVVLQEPAFNLFDDPDTGWNFLRVTLPRSEWDGEREGAAAKSEKRPDSDLDLRIRMRNPDIRITDTERGKCRIRFEEEALFGFRSSHRENLKSIRITGKGRLEGEFRNRSDRSLPPLVGELVTAVGMTPAFDLGLEASLRGESWEIASRQNPGMILESASSELALSRFRFAGRREVDGSFKLGAAAVESATIETASWNHPAIERLEVPWTEPPRGTLKLGLGDFQFEKDRIRCFLSGIHIKETTLSIEALPWLKVLTSKDGWKLTDVDLSGALDYSILDGTIRWDSGKIEFDSGKGGRIGTSGTFRSLPQTEWSVTASVHDFPVPRTTVGEVEVSPGVLSGEMKWLESVPLGSAPVFLAEGHVQLRDGQIGAIRLFGGLDDLLEDEGILTRPFQRFGFGFDLKGERIGISDLILQSEILDLAGNGSFVPGRELEMDLRIKPTPQLAEVLKDGKSRLFASGAAESKDPLQVRATGDLDNPNYSITFGEGMKIPIQGLGLQF